MNAKKTNKAVSDNYVQFKKLLPSIINTHHNKFALMRDGKVENYYSTLEDAVSTGHKFYADGNYSIQKVTTDIVDLGFFSHALHIR